MLLLREFEMILSLAQ